GLRDFQKQELLYKAGLEAIKDLAKDYRADGSFRDAEEARLFARLVRQTLELTFKWIDTSLKTRKAFQKDVGTDITRMLSRPENPLKEAKDAREIGVYLLDSNDRSRLDASRVALEEAFKDLTMHQMGLLEGVKASIKEM